MIAEQLSLVNTFLVSKLTSGTQAKEYFDAQGHPVAKPQDAQHWMSEERAKAILAEWGDRGSVGNMATPAPVKAPSAASINIEHPLLKKPKGGKKQ